mmetsp:Transcript_11070/g.27598  ORF Transcript_11070/g.27598 Transcript_11070/m.27598 type:complete len:254 (+) Transcript_11070:1080-1841(+)
MATAMAITNAATNATATVMATARIARMIARRTTEVVTGAGTGTGTATSMARGTTPRSAASASYARGTKSSLSLSPGGSASSPRCRRSRASSTARRACSRRRAARRSSSSTPWPMSRRPPTGRSGASTSRGSARLSSSARSSPAKRSRPASCLCCSRSRRSSGRLSEPPVRASRAAPRWQCSGSGVCCTTLSWACGRRMCCGSPRFPLASATRSSPRRRSHSSTWRPLRGSRRARREGCTRWRVTCGSMVCCPW